jgi:hypothetical protein
MGSGVVTLRGHQSLRITGRAHLGAGFPGP